MKKEERERLHEDDRFMKFMSAVWDRITRRRRLFTYAVVLAAGALLVWGIAAGLHQSAVDRARSAVDGATTLAEMEQALETHPDEPVLLYRLGAEYALRGEEGDLPKAESCLRRALGASNDETLQALVRVALGTVEMDLKKYEEALKVFDRALRSRTIAFLIRDEVNWYMGRCHELLGQREEAEDRYSRISVGRRDRTWESLAAYRRVRLRQESLE